MLNYNNVSGYIPNEIMITGHPEINITINNKEVKVKPAYIADNANKKLKLRLMTGLKELIGTK